MPFGLTNNNRANVPFKNIMGRSQTRDVHDLGNEPYGIFLVSSQDYVWTSYISPSRFTAIANGVAVEVNGDLVVHPNSSGQGYTTYWPATPPSGTDLKTGLAFAYNSGSLLGITAGDRLLNSIPPTYNSNGGNIADLVSGYTNRLYSDAGMTAEIALLDPRDWIFQSQSGIYYEETVTLPVPVKIKTWVYIGETLRSTILTLSGATSAGTSGTNGTSGSSGTNGTSGSSGTNGTDGTSGSSGTNGTSGSSGTNGTDGTSGSSGFLTLTGSTEGDMIYWNNSTQQWSLPTSGINWDNSQGTLNVNKIKFDTGSTNGTLDAGVVYFDEIENALSYKPITLNNDVSINIGQESVIRVFNNTGVQIDNGQICHITGSHGDPSDYDPIIVLADSQFVISNTGYSNAYISGVATHNIPNNEHGFITNFGIVRDINTSGFTIGDFIYLSDTIPGAFTTLSGLSSKCSRANKVGSILLTGLTNGMIFVDIQNENEISNISQRRLNDLTINNASTGVISFEGISINSGTNTKFDVGPLQGWLADNTTDPYNPTIRYINFTGLTAITPLYIATNPVTYIAIDKDLNIIQSQTPYTNSQTRDYIDLGVIVHSNNTIINVVNNQPVVQIDAGNQLYDLMRGLGFFNVNGNVFHYNDGNLMLDKTSGNIFKQGSNFENDIKNPHQKFLGSLSALTFNYRLRTSVEYSGLTNVDPNYYDLNGVRTLVDNNKFTVQRIAIFSSNSVRIQYGQQIYASLAEAVAEMNTESFVVEPNIAGNGLFRCFLILKQGITDLSNTDDALFIEAGRFGENLGSAAGGVSLTTLQNAYDNSVIPQIVTNSTLDGVIFRRGSTSDNDRVFAIQNGSGSTVVDIDGTGRVIVNSLVISGITSSTGLTRFVVVDSTGRTYYQENSPTSGSSGTNGTSGSSGTNGTSGSSGTNGTSGSSGTNGTSGSSGTNGTSGSSGTNGTSGSSGTNGTNGTSGSSGTNGTSGSSGTNGTSGSSGTNGTSGSSGSSGTNGTSGSSGSSGTNGTSGSSGTNGTSGSSGSSGTNGTSGSSGTNGTSGSSGTNGTSGSSGSSGTNGTSGSSGTNGTSGSSGTNGTSGSSGTNGTSGSSGTNGTSGSSGTNGTSGSSGTNGTSGSSGTNGTSGTGFNTIANPLDNRILTSDGTPNAANAEPNLTFDGNTLVLGGATGSTGTVITVIGSSGQLMNVTDTLTGVIFQVGDISGIPIFQVNSNGAIYISSVTLNAMTSAGSPYSLLSVDKTTGSAAFYDYSTNNGTAYRSGTVMVVWDGTNVVYTDTSTSDLGGSTIPISFSAVISGSNIVLSAEIVSGTWTVKIGARII